MINCPQCGAENPDEIKRCGECGTALPAQGNGTRCPMCAHYNPLGRETCERCNARLIPLVASSPSKESVDLSSGDLSVSTTSLPRETLPTEAPSIKGDETDEGDSDWLQHMRASVVPGEVGWEAEAESDPVAGSSSRPESPDWLSRLESPDITRPVEHKYEPEAETETGRETSALGEEVPDWLAELASTEDASAEAKAEMPALEEEVPDWLAELTPAEGAQAGEEAEMPALEEEVPDWLAELAPTEDASAEVEVEMPALEEEVPDWLAELAPAKDTSAEAEMPVLEGGETPDWLAELAPTEDAQVEAEMPTLEGGETPDWVAELAPVEDAQVEAEMPALEGGETPDWLAELGPAGEALAEEEAQALEEVAIPDWLTDLGPAEDAAEVEAEPLPLEEADVPDWMMSLAPPMPSENKEGELAQAEIPAGLHTLGPGVVSTAVLREEEGEAETSGLLAGIVGVVQPASVITALPPAPAQPDGTSTEATLARASLWQELIARSVQPSSAELPRSRVREARDHVERWLVYGIVLLAVLLPVVAKTDLSDIFDRDEPLTEAARAAFEVVDKTGFEDEPVLVAFDYDPAYVGELQIQAEALFHHLVENRARIVAISLTPEGAGLAQQLIDDLLIDQDYRAGQDYVNLGFLPGEAAGIRSLEFLPQPVQRHAFDGRDLKDTPILDNGFALSKMSLIVVFSGNANNLRWWVEQTTVVEKDLNRELPLVAGVSAAIEPLVRPYYDMESRQIDGLIVGLAGATDYERELGILDGPAQSRLDGQLVGQLAVSTLILIGMLIYGLSGRGGVD